MYLLMSPFFTFNRLIRYFASINQILHDRLDQDVAIIIVSLANMLKHLRRRLILRGIRNSTARRQA